MATIRTVFIDTALSGYAALADQYDAGLVAVVLLDAATPGPLQIQNWMTAHGLGAADINVVSASASLNGLFTPRVIFVDPSVADYQSLIASTPAGATIVVLDAGRDGVEQIQQFLEHNSGLVAAIDIVTNLSSIDVVAHGAPGQIQLGSAVLSGATLASYGDALAAIGSHLTGSADILLYGCDVGAGTVGQQFIAGLAAATGADVAASTNLTGSAAAGGDWVLEAQTGNIETAALSSTTYGGTLDTALSVPTFALSADTGTSSTDFLTRTATQTISGTFTASANKNPQAPVVYISTDGSGATRTQATVTYTDDAGSGTFTVNATLASGAGKSIQFWSGASGNNPISTARSYTVDTMAPTTSVGSAIFSNDSGASNTDLITATAAQTISGTLSAATASGEVVRVSLDGGNTWQTASNTAGSSTFSMPGVTLSGSSTLIVQVEDAAGNGGPALSRAYVLDTSAPAAGTLGFNSLTDTGTPGDGISSDNTFNLALAGNDASATVLYQVSTNGGGAWSTTSTAQNSLANGTYQFRAQVTDAAGNTSTSNTVSVVIDASAPDAPAITGFSANSGSPLDTLTNDSTPTLTISAEANATVMVYQAGVAVGTATQTAPGSGSYSFTSSVLADGNYSFTAKVTDAAGNVSAASAAQSIAVDTTADTGGDLVVQVADNLIGNAEKGAVAYTVLGKDDDATTTVTFKDASNNTVVGVNGKADLSTLIDGQITVSVSATDTAGNIATGTNAATVLDTTADVGHDLSVQLGDSLVNNAEKSAVAYTVFGNDSDATATVTFKDASNNTVVGINGKADLSTLADDPITVSVSATDAAGNTATGTGAATVLDTSADVGHDLAVKLDDSLINNAEKGAVAYTVFGKDDDATTTVTFKDASNNTVVGVNGKADLSTLTDGPITVAISATDAAGNTATGIGAATVLDTTADAGGNLAVSVADSLIGNAEKNAVAYTVTGLDADATATVTFSDGTHSVTGSNGTVNLTTLTDGPITVAISASDAAGNTANGTGAATVLDTTADAGNNLAVSVADSLIGNAEKHAVAYLVAGLDADATATVTFSDGTHSVTGSNGTANLSTLTDGPIIVAISATDAAGNSATGAGASTALDTTADAGGNLAVSVADSLIGNAEKTAVAYTVTGLDADATATVTFSDGTHSVTGTNGTANLTTLTDGPITVAISATDAAGNTATGTGAATVLDTTADAGGNLAVSMADSLIGNAEKNAVAYTVAGLDADATATVTFSDGTHSVSGSNGKADLSTLTDGPITVTISATDAAGNSASGTGAATVLDTTADAGNNLAVSVADSLIGNAEKHAVAYLVAGLDADATATVTFSDGTHSVTGSNGTANLTTLTDGPITVTISATDAAGNTATGTGAATVLDTTADAGGNLAVSVADSLIGNAEKNAVAYTVTGLDADATATVTFSDGTHTVTGTNGTANLTTLTDGPITVAISATDAAGNNATGTSAATVLDTTADLGSNLAVQLADSQINNLEKATVAYTVTGLDGDATAVITVSDGIHTAIGINGKVDLGSLTDGPLTVAIAATDAAGNAAAGTGANLALDTRGPAFSSGATAVLAENSGANRAVYTAAASDVHPVSYSLLANNADDAAAFSIAANGSVTLTGNPDYETKSSYRFTVQAADSFGNLSQQAVMLSITDVNEAPSAAPVGLMTVETAVITTSLVGLASDVDYGDSLSFSLMNSTAPLAWGADSTSQSLINPVTRAAVNLASLNVQAALSTDGTTLSITPSAELSWLSTGQSLRATFSYKVTDKGGMASTDTISLLITGATGDQGLKLNGGNGNDTLSGNTSNNANDVLQGANGDDVLNGYGGTDALYGGNGDDMLLSGAGIDYLYGDSGNDTLDGGTEGDYLLGGKGNDMLTGGSGADKFVFEPQYGNDRITDFRIAEGDRLYFADFFSTPMTADAFVAKYVTDTGNDLLISLPGGSIVLVGVPSIGGLAAAISFGMPS